MKQLLKDWEEYNKHILIKYFNEWMNFIPRCIDLNLSKKETRKQEPQAEQPTFENFMKWLSERKSK